jgi:hypothetical protein
VVSRPGQGATQANNPSSTSNGSTPLSGATPPPSNGAAAIESLRNALPELGALIDNVNREVNSPNIAPPSQWQTHNESTSAASDHPPQPTTSRNERQSIPGVTQSADESSNDTSSPNDEDAKSSPQETDDEDYAEICRSESVKNGLKSLKQDLEEAQKSPDKRHGYSFFVKKLKLQWATLKKCARDPLEKAVIEKLEHDPIIFDAQ